MTKKLILLPFLLCSQSVFAGFGGDNTGGMDGGGGGTLPAQASDPYEIQLIAQQAKPKVLFVLNAWERFHGIPTPLSRKLFEGSRRVQDVLKDLRLEVRMDRPCYTSQGTEVEASIYGAKAGTICLSAFKIAPKVAPALAEREVVALIAHEVSHFMGATEDEARALQVDIANAVTNAFERPEFVFGKDKSQISSKYYAFIGRLYAALQALDTNPKDRNLIAGFLDEAIHGQQDVDKLTTSNDFAYSMFSPRELDYQEILKEKLVKAWSDAKLSSTNLAALRSAIVELMNEYSTRSNYVNQVLNGTKWLELNGATTSASNFFKNHLGTYTVESTQCDAPVTRGDVVGFQIKADNGTVRLIENGTSWMTQSDLELGAYNLNVSVNRYGKYSDDDIYFVQENGGAWDGAFMNYSFGTTYRFKKLDNNKFEITKTDYYQPNDITKVDTVATCIYKGSIR